MFRWLQDDAFREAYQRARSESVRQAVAQVQTAMGAAVRTLVEVMENTEAPASARVSAAKTMIETGIKAVEFEEIELRLTAIERELKKETRGFTKR
ncbi:hypothetical protein ACFLZM_06075 [Thermodesulfobacteriota bacterium]